VDPLRLPASETTVLVSPEGPLCYLPWGALLPGRAVALTPSGTTHVLLRDEERGVGEGVLALGDPEYPAAPEDGALAVQTRGRRLLRLAATRDEATAAGDVVLLGPEANERVFRERVASRKRWRAVHLACHGLVDPERPTLSSLAFTPEGDEDGFLTCLEVLRMRIPADLAVLSACDTGRGKVVQGEGIVGLTRAFMYAGAPRVLCSLWPVDDRATGALMVRFYELWNPRDGRPSVPVAEALRRAQEHVRSTEGWAHPRCWAAWVLWGLPD
jgi:CHAT domain-containing protein